MKRTIWEIIKFAAVALLIILPIRFWIAQPFIVSGASMDPSFFSGDYLIIDELSYQFQEPKRGEVVIFKPPQEQGRFFIKRIIGLPGDVVEIKSNKIYIYNKEYPKGMIIDEFYLSQSVNTYPDLRMVLGQGEYFVLGDNRMHSSDSRIWGAVKEDSIVGRALIRLWPVKNIAIWPGT